MRFAAGSVAEDASAFVPLMCTTRRLGGPRTLQHTWWVELVIAARHRKTSSRRRPILRRLLVVERELEMQTMLDFVHQDDDPSVVLLHVCASCV